MHTLWWNSFLFLHGLVLYFFFFQIALPYSNTPLHECSTISLLTVKWLLSSFQLLAIWIMILSPFLCTMQFLLVEHPWRLQNIELCLLRARHSWYNHNYYKKQSWKVWNTSHIFLVYRDPLISVLLFRLYCRCERSKHHL